MLRATVEYVPLGDESRAQVVSRMAIVNDGTGDRDSGNYRATVEERDAATGAWSRSNREVKGWPRTRRTAWALVREVLAAREKGAAS